MIRLAVFGGGKMAQELVRLLGASEQLELQAVISRQQPQWLDSSLYLDSLDVLDPLPDAVLDFTLQGGTDVAAQWCRARLVPLLSGTTGLSDEDRQALRAAARLVPVLWAANFSEGLNLTLMAVSETAAALPADTPVEILDVHHEHKKDAPSGTALLLAQAVASARGVALAEQLDIFDESDAPPPKAGRIHCLSRRVGETVGTHRVRFLAAGQEVQHSHVASERGIYAEGALQAVQWLLRQPAGLYSGADWLAPGQGRN